MIFVGVIFLILFTLDLSTIVFLPLHPLISNYFITPNFLFLGLCIFCFFDQKNHVLWVALFTGFIYDVYFTNLIGLHMSLFPLTVIVIKRFVVPISPLNFISLGSAAAVCLLIKDVTIYTFFYIFGHQSATFLYFLQYRFIVTLIFNFIVLLLLYFPLTKSFKAYKEKLKSH